MWSRSEHTTQGAPPSNKRHEGPSSWVFITACLCNRVNHRVSSEQQLLLHPSGWRLALHADMYIFMIRFRLCRNVCVNTAAFLEKMKEINRGVKYVRRPCPRLIGWRRAAMFNVVKRICAWMNARKSWWDTLTQGSWERIFVVAEHVKTFIWVLRVVFFSSFFSKFWIRDLFEKKKKRDQIQRKRQNSGED